MKKWQKTNQKEFRIEKIIKKGDKLYVKWKGYDNSFNSWINKKPFNVKVDLSNYATKTDLKDVVHVDTSSLALKTNLASLKTEVYKVDIDKIVSVLVDLSKLSDAVKMMLLKRLCMIN